MVSNILLSIFIICEIFVLIQSQVLLSEVSRASVPAAPPAVSADLPAIPPALAMSPVIVPSSFQPALTSSPNFRPAPIVQPFVPGFVVIPQSPGSAPAISQPGVVSSPAYAPQPASQQKIQGFLVVPQAALTPAVVPALNQLALAASPNNALPQAAASPAVVPVVPPPSSVQKTVLIQPAVPRPSIITPSANPQVIAKDEDFVRAKPFSDTPVKYPAKSKESESSSAEESKESLNNKRKVKHDRIQAGGGKIGFVKTKFEE